MSEKQWYPEYQAQLKEEQASKTRNEIRSELETKSEHVFDPDNAPGVKHRWIDRGEKLSCEGANHPYHQVWKRR